jgi:hypothetical protein
MLLLLLLKLMKNHALVRCYGWCWQYYYYHRVCDVFPRCGADYLMIAVVSLVLQQNERQERRGSLQPAETWLPKSISATKNCCLAVFLFFFS